MPVPTTARSKPHLDCLNEGRPSTCVIAHAGCRRHARRYRLSFTSGWLRVQPQPRLRGLAADRPLPCPAQHLAPPGNHLQEESSSRISSEEKKQLASFIENQLEKPPPSYTQSAGIIVRHDMQRDNELRSEACNEPSFQDARQSRAPSFPAAQGMCQHGAPTC